MDEQTILEMALAAHRSDQQEREDSQREEARVQAEQEAARLAALRPEIAAAMGIDRDWTEPLVLNGHRLVAGRAYGEACLYLEPACVECGGTREHEYGPYSALRSLGELGSAVEQPAQPWTCFSCSYREAVSAVPDRTPEAAFVAALVDLLSAHGYQFSDGSGYAVERLQERVERVSKEAASARRAAADAESRAADAEDMARKAGGRRW